MKYKGSCLCGAIEYEVAKFSPHMGHCHCSMCRKFHGAAFATFGTAEPHDFRWIKGELQLQSYLAPNDTIRQFCKICGSSLTFVPAKNSSFLVEIALGTLDTPIVEKPDAHIFVKSKANWSTIKDNLPQYDNARKEGN